MLGGRGNSKTSKEAQGMKCQMAYVSCQKYEENVYRKKLLNLERQKQIN
jgi:hypothetical protein